MNPLIQCNSRTAAETSLNAFSTNQGTKEDDSQSDPYPEACILHNQMTQNLGSVDGQDMVTGVHGEVTYCSPRTSSGKQKKNRSISPPHFCSQYNHATIEADQILLAFQQFANNNNSANFHNNVNRISNLPKSLTTTTPTFDCKSEKFGLFKDLFKRA